MNQNIFQNGVKPKLKANALKGSITLNPIIRTNMMKDHAHFFVPKIFQNNNNKKQYWQHKEKQMNFNAVTTGPNICYKAT